MAPRHLVVVLLGALAAASLLLAGSTTVDAAAAAPGRVIIVSSADTVLPRTAFFDDGISSNTHVVSDSSAGSARRHLDPPRSVAPVPACNASEAADTVLLLLPRTPPVAAADATPGSAPHDVGPGHGLVIRRAGDDDAASKDCGAFLRKLGAVFLAGVSLGCFSSRRYVMAEARRVKATAATAAAAP